MQKVSIERSVWLGDIGLHEAAGADKAVFAFLNWAEAVATRWIQHRAGILLCVAVPGDPQSGACYLYVRREGVFHCLDLPGADNGQLSSEQFDQLVRQFRLIELARRPRKFYATNPRESQHSRPFASAA
jgi:hypothetical protein